MYIHTHIHTLSYKVTEPQSMQALALAMAKLTQVESYMQIMIHLDLLRVVSLCNT